MQNRDGFVGANLQKLRSSASLTQTDLAERMREAGFKWTQATVWAVEKGERPVRLTEADQLRFILGLGSIRYLLQQPVDAHFEMADDLQRKAWARVQAEYGIWADSMLQLAYSLDAVEAAAGRERLQKLVDASSDPDMADPEEFIRSAQTRGFQELRAEVADRALLMDLELRGNRYLTAFWEGFHQDGEHSEAS